MASTSASKTNGSGPSTADLAEQVAQIKGDMGELTSLLKDLGLTKAEEARSAAKAHVEAGKQKGAETLETLKSQGQDASAKAEDYVKAQPATALGIAAGVGFLIGLMATRRS